MPDFLPVAATQKRARVRTRNKRRKVSKKIPNAVEKFINFQSIQQIRLNLVRFRVFIARTGW